MKYMKNLKRSREFFIPYLFFTPALIAIVGIYFFPVVYSLILSFTDKSLIGQNYTFTGLENFASLFHSWEFWRALGHSFLWTLFGVIGSIGIGFLLALFLNIGFFGSRFVTTLFMIPWIIPTIATGIVWKWMFNEAYGYLNYALQAFGLVSKPIGFLSDPRYALYAVLLVLIWRGYPFPMLVILSGLKTIDNQLYEAARVDGANKVQELIFITVPQLIPFLLILFILETIWIFNFFDLIYMFTGGGPAGSSEILATLVYKTAFKSFEVGYACSIGLIMLTILILLIIPYFHYFGKQINI